MGGPAIVESMAYQDRTKVERSKRWWARKTLPQTRTKLVKALMTMPLDTRMKFLEMLVEDVAK